MDNDEKNKPGKSLQILAILTLIACAFPIWAIGGSLAHIYHFSAFLSPGFAILFIWIAYNQYNAVFKNDIQSAKTISTTLAVVSILSLVILIVSLGELISDKNRSIESKIDFVLKFGGGITCIVLFFSFCSIMNLKWSKTIKQTNTNELTNPKNKKLKSVIIFIGASLLVFAGGYAYSSIKPQYKYGENVESVSWLPESASNISYYIHYWHTAYEFDISKEDFMKWVKSKYDAPIKIKTPVKINRYNRFDLSNKIPYITIDYSKMYKINTGYMYEDLFPNGGCVRIIFDSENSRAYYESWPR